MYIRRLIIVFLIIVIIYILFTQIASETEHFDELSILTNGSGQGFELPASNRPLFLNFYPDQMSTDFSLSSIIRKLKFLNQNFPTGYNGRQYGLYTNTGQVNIGPKMTPVIIIPGLGSSKIYAQWNKSNSATVKKIDVYGNFEQNDKWSCKQVQDTWTPIWFPTETDPIAEKCWSDNTKIELNGNEVVNSDGVSTIVPNMGDIDFESKETDTLLKGLRALGLVDGSSLFGASYDFRKIASPNEFESFRRSLVALIERSVYLNGKKAILVSHDLGSTITNIFLNSMPKIWKDNNIQCFFMLNPAIGGCPKALRTFLSGDIIGKSSKLIRDTTMNFTGLQLMLPSPELYQMPLLFFRQVAYFASDIPKLMSMIGKKDTVNIYNNIVRPMQQQSFIAPNVSTYILVGTNVNTESNYLYEDSLLNDPNKNSPFYRSNQGYQNNYDYPANFNGSGTMPKFVFDIYKSWVNKQREPVFFREYEKAEQALILSMADPVKDLLSVVKDYNKII